MSKYTRTDLQRMMQAHLKEILLEDEVDRASGLRRRPIDPATGNYEYDNPGIIEAYELHIRELEEGKYDRAVKLVDYYLEEHSITDIEKGSATYNLLCREMLRTQLRALDVIRLKERGRYDQADELEQELTTQPQQSSPHSHHQAHAVKDEQGQVDKSILATTPASDEGKSTPLSKVIEEFRQEQVKAERWSPKSEAENLSCYQLFLDFAGNDITVDRITYPRIREYKAALQKLPANMKKSPKYRDKGIHELLQMDIEKPMSTNTINKYLNRLATLFKYAVKNGWMNMNPAEGMELPQKRRDDELRAVFDESDLHRLFHSPEYAEDQHKYPYQFWTPLIALFTGMRQNEIAQLHLEDIRQQDGIWVFDINANGPDKKLKTVNAKRLIPIHSFLAEDLRLPEYVQSLKDQNEVRLFPEIKKGRDGYAQTISRWFNGNSSTKQGYKNKCGIVSDLEREGKKDFHSFRHTLINHLKQQRVDAQLLHEFDGHSTQSMTMGRYGKRYEPQLVLDEIVSKITFHRTIPLDHLTGSKWVSTI